MKWKTKWWSYEVIKTHCKWRTLIYFVCKIIIIIRILHEFILIKQNFSTKSISFPLYGCPNPVTNTAMACNWKMQIIYINSFNPQGGAKGSSKMPGWLKKKKNLKAIYTNTTSIQYLLLYNYTFETIIQMTKFSTYKIWCRLLLGQKQLKTFITALKEDALNQQSTDSSMTHYSDMLKIVNLEYCSCPTSPVVQISLDSFLSTKHARKWVLTQDKQFTFISRWHWSYGQTRSVLIYWKAWWYRGPDKCTGSSKDIHTTLYCSQKVLHTKDMSALSSATVLQRQYSLYMVYHHVS